MGSIVLGVAFSCGILFVAVSQQLKVQISSRFSKDLNIRKKHSRSEGKEPIICCGDRAVLVNGESAFMQHVVSSMDIFCLLIKIPISREFGGSPPHLWSWSCG